MSVKSSIEKLSNSIGFDIGSSDDIVQADLLNGFCRGISNSMNSHDRGMQICAIVDKLDSTSHSILKEIAEFIKLKENNK